MADTLVSTQVAPERKNIKDKVVGFFIDVNKEMKKVTWPTREQLISIERGIGTLAKFLKDAGSVLGELYAMRPMATS